MQAKNVIKVLRRKTANSIFFCKKTCKTKTRGNTIDIDIKLVLNFLMWVHYFHLDLNNRVIHLKIMHFQAI